MSAGDLAAPAPIARGTRAAPRQGGPLVHWLRMHHRHIGTALLVVVFLVTTVAADDDDDEDAPKRPKKPRKKRTPVQAIVPGLERQPYLQSLAQDSVLVAWVASAEGEPAVDYGTASAAGATVGATSDGARRVATLRGLQPGTTYRYRVRAGDRVLAEGDAFTFRTADGPGDDRYAFFVTGDVGDPKGRHDLTAASILRSEPRPELGLICGDVVYQDGLSEDYDSHLMHPWRDLFCRIPVWPALGNHDWHEDPSQNFQREWYLPNNEHYYSFDWGNAHFVALDTRDGDIYDRANQVRWLEQDLAAHRGAAWTFVYFHHPGLTCTYKGDTQAVVESLLPVFDRFRVDVVFTGHAHTYERLFPIRERRPVDAAQDPNYVDPGGTIYITSGAGSKVKRGRPTEHCGPTAFFRDETVLWTHVRVEGTRCTIRTVTSAADELVDAITITKTRNGASD
jgi:hypothetical protein